MRPLNRYGRPFAALCGLIVVLTFGCQHPNSSVEVHQPISAQSTLAHELLAAELGSNDETQEVRLLSEIIDKAVIRFGKAVNGEVEEATARRFFQCVDQTLIEYNFIFPPRGLIDLLQNALKPRSLSQDDFDLACLLTPNRRRRQAMLETFRKNGPFYVIDCDLSSILYVAVAERTGMPIRFVEVPKHNFVRWSSPTLQLNWDSNDGTSYSDDQYSKQWGVTAVGRQQLGWLQDMTRDRIRSYWFGLVASSHGRHKRYAHALAAHRSAVSVCPTDLGAKNDLAWFLATCPDPEFRRGQESVSLAQEVVTAVPRANWLDTLAAAQAECGEFKMAKITEQRAKSAAQTSEWGTSIGESPTFDQCIAAYERGLTYSAGVKMGLIKETKEDLPYDD